MNENIEKSIFSGINSTTSNTSFYMNSTAKTDSKRDTVTISVEEFERLISSEKENKELRDELQNLKTLIEITMRAEEFKEEITP